MSGADARAAAAYPIILAAADVARLSWRIAALEVMREAFRSLGGGTAVQPPQTLTLLPRDAGDFIAYLGVLAEAKVFGAKLSPYLSRPGGGFVTAWTILMSMETGQPILLCDSKQLTVERTAATTALAVELLAPQSAARLSVIGAGPAAKAHIRHIRNLRQWRDIRVHSRSLARSPQAGEVMASIDDRVRLETTLHRALDEADVVLLCTSSGTAVIDPASLRKPALITSISTNAPKAHEVPPGSLGNMDVYCDYRVTTPSSAGEMQLAAAEHGWSPMSVVGDLPELATASAALPSYDRHVFFRSIGLGLEDVAMAHALHQLIQSDPFVGIAASGGSDMNIAPFAVEQWMNAHETKCRFNLAETCVESLTIAELLDMAGQRATVLEELLPLKMTYGAIEGSDRLRTAIAGLYTSRSPANVLVTHGAIGANALVYQALVAAGDRIVTILPTYQQHYSIPESLGADVQRLHLHADNGYLPDLEELRRLVTPGTKLIAFSNPNNPTGSLMDRSLLEGIVRIAASVNAYILSDEVYRGTAQEHDTLTPSIADLYPRGISTGSMSKAFSLAGFRLGWICGPSEVLRAAEIHRDYNTISVGILDDLFSSIALENRDKILARSRRLVRTNLATLDRWMQSESALSYVKPRAGTVTLLKYAVDMPSQEFCVRLLEETGVLFTPGSAFEIEGCVRIGYANGSAILEEGLRRTSGFLRRLAS